MKKKTATKKPRSKSDKLSEFAQFVINLRTINHWTPQELADKIGRARSAVTNVESDLYELPITFFQLLSPLLTAGQREYVEMMFQAQIVKMLRTPPKVGNNDGG